MFSVGYWQCFIEQNIKKDKDKNTNIKKMNQTEIETIQPIDFVSVYIIFFIDLMIKIISILILCC